MDLTNRSVSKHMLVKYDMVGNFRGYKFCKTGQSSQIFVVLIFAVSESGTRGLTSTTAKH